MEEMEYDSLPSSSSETSTNSGEDILDDANNHLENPYPCRPPFLLQQGQEFENAQAFRKALINAAISSQFEIKFPKSEKTRVIGECNGEDCKWRIYAAKVQDASVFKIITLRDHHICRRLDHRGNKLAGAKWVSERVMEMIRKHPEFKVRMIQSYIKNENKIDIEYMTAWRAKDRCLTQIYGSWEDSYKQLPSYLNAMLSSNPNSIAVLKMEEGTRFQRLFLSYRACISGFIRGCRLLLFIDGTHAKRGYGGIILTAVSLDGNGKIFPLAFSMVENESKQTWEWFFHQLRPIISQHPHYSRLTIISDRMKGLSDSVSLYFPDAFHGNCAWHLSQNMEKRFGKKLVKHHFWSIAKAFTNVEYQDAMKGLEAVSKEAVAWIKNNNPENWAISKFQGDTYGHITSNVAESFNNWIKPARFLPILAMMERIRLQLMKKFHDAHENVIKWNKYMTPYAENLLTSAATHSKQFYVIPASEFIYEVRDEKNWGFRVDLCAHTCTCISWQCSHLPCSHASAAIHTARGKASIYEFCHPYYSMKLYSATYAEHIVPVLPETPSGFSITNEILPPKIKRKAGRPKTKRKRSEALKEKRVMHCSICKRAGHIKTSCNGA